MPWKILLGLYALSTATNARARDVVVVLSPGFSFAEHRPLFDEILRAEHDLHVVGASCVARGSDSLIQSLREKDRELGGHYTVVSHGLGASLALMAAPELRADQYVLLGPVLDVLPSRAMASLGELEITGPVDLDQSWSWSGLDLREVLLGRAGVMSGCLSMGLAAELQGWLRTGRLPLELEAIDEPVWLGLSLADEMSPVEVVVPASRRFSNRRLVRFGINRFDERDFSHWDLLTDPTPLRVAVRQIGAQR
jgi:hypothetical protein